MGVHWQKRKLVFLFCLFSVTCHIYGTCSRLNIKCQFHLLLSSHDAPHIAILMEWCKRHSSNQQHQVTLTPRVSAEIQAITSSNGEFPETVWFIASGWSLVCRPSTTALSVTTLSCQQNESELCVHWFYVLFSLNLKKCSQLTVQLVINSEGSLSP